MKVLWTEPAADAFRGLSGRLQRVELDRLEMIAEFPEVYPVRHHSPYAGFCYVVVEH